MAAYATIGIILPHYAQDQAKMGTPVPIGPDSVQPGDLIFTKDSEGRINGHVGIAQNRNSWITAPHTGAVVHESAIPWQSVTAVRRLV